MADEEADLEDEIAQAGGDPSFLDDQSWVGGVDEDEADLEDDITASGGDASFLDESEWKGFKK